MDQSWAAVVSPFLSALFGGGISAYLGKLIIERTARRLDHLEDSVTKVRESQIASNIFVVQFQEIRAIVGEQGKQLVELKTLMEQVIRREAS